MIKALHGSAGSTKGAGIIGAWNGLIDNGYEPDIISGVSVSAILAVPYALGLHKELTDIMLNADLCTIFSVPPVKENGKIRFNAILRAITGKSFGSQKNVISLLSDLVPESRFNIYKNSPSYPDVIIMTVDYVTGKRIFKNMKKVSYQEFLKYTLASSSVPLMTEPVCVDDMVLYDGGTRDYIISHYVNLMNDVNQSVSVYSKPGDMESLDKNWCPKNDHIDPMMRAIDIMMLEVSKGDVEKELIVAERMGIDNHIIHLPKVLDNLYDTNPEKLEELYYEGYKLGRYLL